MKNEKLMRAMGEIDEDLILEAREVRKPRVHWVRWSALAACLAFLMLCTPVLFVILDGMGSGKEEMEGDCEIYYSEEDSNSKNSKPLSEGKTDGSLGFDDVKESASADQIQDALEESDDEELLEKIKKLQEKLEDGEGMAQYHVGDTVRTDKASVVYVSSDASSVSLHIKKNTDDPLVFSVIVYDAEEAWTVSTEGEDRDAFSVTVNGEKVNELPDEAGVYDITVDLSTLTQNPNWRLSDWLVIEDICILIRGNE